jgi:hypothetical protein
VAVAASQSLSHDRENAGDMAGSFQAIQRALSLVRDDDGPWIRAMSRTVLAQLAMHMDDRPAAVEHARAALPVMQRLGASDDEIQLRTVLVYCAITDGRLAAAEDELDQVDRIDESATAFGALAFRRLCRAELVLACGDTGAGLSIYREGATTLRELELPGAARTGGEPWVLFGDAMALSAHAHYATGSDEAHGRALYAASREGALRVFGQADERLDLPAAGLLLFGLGAWHLLRQATPPAEEALRLLALADRFAYSRAIPTMRWDRITPAAEQAAPGLLAKLQAQYRDCPQPDLLTEARLAVERLPG